MKRTLIIALIAVLTISCSFGPKNNSSAEAPIADSIDIDHDRLMGYLGLIDSLAQAEFKENEDLIEKNSIYISEIVGEEMTIDDFAKISRSSQQTWDNLVSLVDQKHYKKAVDFYFENTQSIFTQLKTSQWYLLLHRKVIAPIVPLVYPKEQADSVLISDIEYIRVITEATMEMVPAYIPEHYSDVLFLASQYYYNQYDYDKAIEVVHTQREWVIKAYGKDSYEYGTTLANEAMFLIEKEEYDQSLTLFREAYKIFTILTDSFPEDEKYCFARDQMLEYIMYVDYLADKEREE